MDQHRRDVRATGHEETGKVRDAFVVEGVDGGQDHHAHERQGESSDDVECPFAEVIGRLGDTEEDNETSSIGCHGPQVGFDDGVAQTLYDLEINNVRNGDSSGFHSVNNHVAKLT